MANASPAEKAILIDCFAGVGGNAIAFALSGRWKRVYAIERDSKVLECAKHNAEIYGVHNQISWYQADCFELLRKELADLVNHSVIFASPPWGGKCNLHDLLEGEAILLIATGPGYRSDQVFDLSSMRPYSINDLLNLFLDLTSDVVLYLPRTSNLRQLAARVQEDEKLTVIHYCMEGASKVQTDLPCLQAMAPLLTHVRLYALTLATFNLLDESPEYLHYGYMTRRAFL